MWNCLLRHCLLRHTFTLVTMQNREQNKSTRLPTGLKMLSKSVLTAESEFEVFKKLCSLNLEIFAISRFCNEKYVFWLSNQQFQSNLLQNLTQCAPLECFHAINRILKVFHFLSHFCRFFAKMSSTSQHHMSNFLRNH